MSSTIQQYRWLFNKVSSTIEHGYLLWSKERFPHQYINFWDDTTFNDVTIGEKRVAFLRHVVYKYVDLQTTTDVCNAYDYDCDDAIASWMGLITKACIGEAAGYGYSDEFVATGLYEMMLRIKHTKDACAANRYRIVSSSMPSGETYKTILCCSEIETFDHVLDVIDQSCIHSEHNFVNIHLKRLKYGCDYSVWRGKYNSSRIGNDLSPHYRLSDFIEMRLDRRHKMSLAGRLEIIKQSVERDAYDLLRSANADSYNNSTYKISDAVPTLQRFLHSISKKKIQIIFGNV